MKTLSVRLPEQFIHDIEEAAGQESVDKGAMVCRLIGNGLKEYRIKKAFEFYVEGKISLWKAASQAGLTYRGKEEGKADAFLVEGEIEKGWIVVEDSVDEGVENIAESAGIEAGEDEAIMWLSVGVYEDVHKVVEGLE